VLKLAFASLLVLPVLAAGATVALPTEPADAATSFNAQVVSLTNKHRANAGCRGLLANVALSRSARAHSAEMARYNNFSHSSRNGRNFVQRGQAAGYPYAMAENIAVGQLTPATVVRDWMRSPGHRRNILNCKAKTVGVGVSYSASRRPYWTQDFGSV
jgi:uncharacterized protein YkwD